jgi:hypothetical protein
MRLLPLCAAALLTACTAGSGSTSLDGGSSGTTAAPLPTSTTGGGGDGGSGGPSTAVPQAIVQAKLAKGASGTCLAAGQSIAIGTFSPIAPAKHGDVGPDGAKTELSCKVAPEGSGFAINVSFDVSNAGAVVQGFAMSGLRTASGTANGSALVGFALPDLDYASTACTFDPTAATGGVGGIAAGRYWTTFHCTDAQRNGSSDLCDIDGEVRVENCIQQ